MSASGIQARTKNNSERTCVVMEVLRVRGTSGLREAVPNCGDTIVGGRGAARRLYSRMNELLLPNVAASAHNGTQRGTLRVGRRGHRPRRTPWIRSTVGGMLVHDEPRWPRGRQNRRVHFGVTAY